MAPSPRDIVEPTRPALADVSLLPVPPPLEGLLPWGGLRRGSTVVAEAPSLALALVARSSAAGSWCAAVGLSSLGLAAAAEAGVALERLAVVAHPGPDWLAVTAALLDAFAVVVVRPPERVRPADGRRLVARAKQRRSVLLPLGAPAAWEGAEVRLAVTASRWEGLGQGDGHLRARLVEVRAEGRGAAARPRTALLWLPAEGGGVRAAADERDRDGRRPIRAAG
ncbi:MAG: hypothetical protein H0V93_17045 [Euzebyales bacterium]|nr:hypothetical protein [Euzebyales bacterium]